MLFFFLIFLATSCGEAITIPFANENPFSDENTEAQRIKQVVQSHTANKQQRHNLSPNSLAPGPIDSSIYYTASNTAFMYLLSGKKKKMGQLLLSRLNLKTTLGGRHYYYPQPMCQETKTQKGYLTCLKSQRSRTELKFCLTLNQVAFPLH